MTKVVMLIMTNKPLKRRQTLRNFPGLILQHDLGDGIFVSTLCF